jgi:hypothetical protein
MSQLTSIVYNSFPYSKQLGLPVFYYRWRSCNSNFPNRTQTNIGGFTPADQYQKLKLIQNTLRIHSSLYTANLGPLTAYTKPLIETGVYWNQMSDRPIPSVQRPTIPTGYNISQINKRHTSVTSSRPGCQTPGGLGCDIKHNSYDRYLNKLKGKGPMRRGIIPPNFGVPLPFDPAFPIYGGKTTKTNIITGCNCPTISSLQNDIQIYNNPYYSPYPSSNYVFKIGDYVYALDGNNTYYTRAQVINIANGIYTIKFDNENIKIVENVNELLIYFPCNCNAIQKEITLNSGVLLTNQTAFNVECNIPIN